MNKEQMDVPKGRGGQEKELLGWLREFFYQFELTWKLVWDDRVPLLTKLVPLATLLYLLLPFDFIPDAFLGLGQVDDVVILLIGLRMFISLCPPAIVAEYDLVTSAHDAVEPWQPSEDEIVDLEVEVPEPAPEIEDESAT
jgi:uncharacterized membrane protein YkvA (DUF1232 family)